MRTSLGTAARFPARRGQHDLGELATPAHRDARHSGPARAACRPARADRDRVGVGVRSGRDRRMPRQRAGREWRLGQAIDAFNSQFDSLNSLIAWMTLVPGLIGVLLAAPFVLEFEQGTHRLAWTQSVSRRRWLVGQARRSGGRRARGVARVHAPHDVVAGSAGARVGPHGLRASSTRKASSCSGTPSSRSVSRRRSA